MINIDETTTAFDLMSGEVEEIETTAETVEVETTVEEINTWEEFLWAACNIEAMIKAYGISKIANATIEFIGVERVLPSQMFYNYSRKGMIAQRILNEKKLNTNHLYSSAEVFEFLKKYIAKNIAK